MLFELFCPRCSQKFYFPSDSPTGRVLEQVIDEGPWSVLGDGQIWEDRVSSAIATHDLIRCPECGGHVRASEETLGRFTLEALSGW